MQELESYLDLTCGAELRMMAMSNGHFNEEALNDKYLALQVNFQWF